MVRDFCVILYKNYANKSYFRKQFCFNEQVFTYTILIVILVFLFKHNFKKF